MQRTRILAFMLVAVLITVSCVLNNVGLYTSDQYNAQATEIASAKANAAAKEAEAASLKVDLKALQTQADDLKVQLATITAARDKADSELADYQKMICPDVTWAQMMKIGVWSISESTGDKSLAQIEKDTKVTFYLTQWLPAGDLPIPNSDSWVLTIDYYNGIALDSAHGCVILDPKMWPVIETSDGMSG